MHAWVRRAACTLALAVALAPAGAPAQTSDLVSTTALRVCADPANYPMSDDGQGGFENRLADLFAEKLGRPVEYTWFPMAMGFVRNTLRDNRCDVVIGYAQGDELVLNTNHYYTSAYVLVVPEDSPLAGVETLGDPALSGQRLGIVAGTPPASHLARYGLLARSKPYQLMVDRRVESPAVDMLRDLAEGTIDAAVLWGPLAGPIVKENYPGMRVIPLLRETGAPRLFYRVTMGVRQGERVWQRELNSLIRRHQDEIDAILVEAGVPLLDDMGTALKATPE
jgi:quinoprotein dehydrogenase-associated probable ABC transporter substrate-binding protein